MTDTTEILAVQMRSITKRFPGVIANEDVDFDLGVGEIHAAFLSMLPYAFTIIVLVLITWWEAFRKRVGAPAALGLPYMREERG
jgi:ABC-type uncharacterized transport system permease subunit